MKQVQEEHLCRDIRRIAQGIERIAKALPYAEQEAPDINVGNIRFTDKDHVWINNKQYISLSRVNQMIEEAKKGRLAVSQQVARVVQAVVDVLSYRQQAIDMLDEQIELCNASLHKGVPEKDAYAIKVERASLMAYREKLEHLPFIRPDLVKMEGEWNDT